MIDLQNPNPLYRQIVADIKSRIAAGQLGKDEKVGSHQQLAEQYGVSLITVKKALSELINQGILYSRVGKGTFVAASSPFVTQSNKTIGIVLRDLKNPFFSLIVDSFEENAYSAGYHALLSTSSNRMDREETQIRRFREMGVNALLIASMSHLYRATTTIRKLHEEAFPYVMVSYVQDQDIFYVGTDHEKGAFLATEHVINLGYERIGYINGEQGSLLGELRKKGYVAALKHYGKPINEAHVFRLRLKGGEHDYQSGYEVGERFVNLPGRPEAMFIYNDLSALGFQKAVLSYGMRVPEDVAMVGFDNIKRGRIAPVPLTTVAQPTSEIGRIAFDSLSKRIAGVNTATRTILAPKLVVRSSCGAELSGKSSQVEEGSVVD
ncbi:MAG: GntR family transcriptional regulator [bacterium]